MFRSILYINDSLFLIESGSHPLFLFILLLKDTQTTKLKEYILLKLALVLLSLLIGLSVKGTISITGK